MENKLLNTTYILLLTLIVGIVDIGAIPKIYPNQQLMLTIISDCFVVLICGFLGIRFYSNENFRLIYTKNTSEKTKTDEYAILIFTIIFILISTYAFWTMYKGAVVIQGWIKTMTPFTAFLLSIRAAITEEVIFRLFLFTLCFIIVKKLSKSDRIALICSTLVTSILFSILLHQGSIISIAGGVLLAYVFYKRGIIRAMIIHFIADFIPFMMIALLNIANK